MVERDSNIKTGLSEETARERLVTDGYNELSGSGRESLSGIILGICKEPMFLLLIAAGIIYFFLGDLHEALMLMSFVILIITITTYQEYKTERTLESLKNLSSPRALVIRDGVRRRIPGREVVRGDILLLSEGDRVAADAVLLTSVNLQVDESLLTGESLPVRKIAIEPVSKGEPYVAVRSDTRVFAGSLVVQGQGIGQVTATGMATEMGRIGTLLEAVERGETRLKTEINSLVKTISMVALVLCLSILLISGLRDQDWVTGLLAGITLAMAILPEEFPVVLTVFMALGAWRIAKKNVLTRQIPAIETLGSATVLCVDKTGTITENRMAVHSFYTNGTISSNPIREGDSLSESSHEIFEYAILACRVDPFDPMEKAIREVESSDFGQTEHIHRTWKMVQEYPLCDDMLAMSQVWQSPEGSEYIIASKGAPEAIADLCHLNPEDTASLKQIVNSMAAEGLRVLGVAGSSHPITRLPEGQHDFRFRFLGLIGFADPVRPGIAEAVADCYSAGIRVIMITGDYPQTASSIATEAGIQNPEQVLSGTDLAQISDEDLAAQVQEVSVFARTVPEQKLRIVEALKASGQVVAMTGDGVNDAPALQAADIGVAMGMRGTDVAREASSLVLLDDNFTSIVSAIRMGRRIFENLKKAIAYIIAVHIPIAGLSLFPVIGGWPLMLLPAHVVFLEMIIDPACSIAFESEPEEKGIMERPPRGSDDCLFSKELIGVAAMQGVTVLAVLGAVFAVLMDRGTDEAIIRTVLFSSLVVANISLIIVNRSWTEPFFRTLKRVNIAMWGVIVLAFLILVSVLTIPFLQGLFRFAPISPEMALLAVVAGVSGTVWFEGLKIWRSRTG